MAGEVLEITMRQMAYFAVLATALGGTLGFIVIITDYVFTSIMSLMKRG